MLFHVPGGRSSLGLPGTVTRPGLTGCLNCLWLPLIRTSRHPSASIIRMASLTLGITRLPVYNPQPRKVFLNALDWEVHTGLLELAIRPQNL